MESGKGECVMMKKLEHIFALSPQGARDFVKAVLLTVVCNISLMFPVGVILLVVQHLIKAAAIGENPADKMLYYTLIAAVILIAIFILHYAQYAALYISVYKESASRRIALAETLRRLPLSFFGKKDLSDLTATMIADCSSLDQMFSHFIPALFAAVISTTIVGISMFAFDAKMALAVLWVVPVALLFTIGSKGMQDKYGTKDILAKREVTDYIQEGLETNRDLKACNRQEIYLKELDRKTRNAEKSAIRTELAAGTFVNAAQAFLHIGMATTVLVGGKLYINGELDLLYFLGFLFAAARIYDPLSLVLMNMAVTFHAKLQINRMRDIIETPTQVGETTFEPKNFDISFENVDFSYRSGEDVLSDVTFKAKQGEVTALVGPSGGGKSTAAKLSARFWDINKGKISIGGRDISEINPEVLLKYYSIVFQDVVLFRDTIMENIRLGKKDATDEEVFEAARAAQCDDFIKELPLGYETIIGENGSTLSGGERQRISIARALLKDAPIVLLDEATASLDVENESSVQEALSKLINNKTVLIIAHRMRTVANVDKIVVLENGRIVQQGSPRELIERGGLYRHMVELQNKSMKWKLS